MIPTGIHSCGTPITTVRPGALAGASDGALVGIIPGITVDGDIHTPTTAGAATTVPGIMEDGDTRIITTVGAVTRATAGAVIPLSSTRLTVITEEEITPVVAAVPMPSITVEAALRAERHWAGPSR
jgi:hypothetical protein